MANQLSGFDPAGAFQGARSRARTIEAQEQSLALQPQRNELAGLKIQKAQQGVLQGDQQQALIRSKFFINAAQALKNVPLPQRQAAAESLLPQAQQIGIDPNTFDLTNLDDASLDGVMSDASTILQSLQTGTTVSALDQARIAKLEAETTALGEEGKAPVIPPALLVGLSDDLATKGSAAFAAAGGGKDGIKAFSAIVDKGSEAERRAASPQILENNFPTASPAEREQLQATMDAAKTTESGLKAAEKLRTEQKRLKKAKTFQVKAVELMGNILTNPQLGDVLGSIEGRIDIRLFSDAEAELIADIDEASNILTADNMDLMTGVLSESDIAILRNLSGGALTRTRTEERFVKDLTELRDRLASEQVVTVDDQAAETRNADLEVRRARLAELRAKAAQ